MSTRRRPQQKTPVRRKPQHDPYTSKIVKPPSNQHLNDELRRAVTQHDADALEDWDEWNWKK